MSMVGERGPSILRSISAAQRADSRRSDRESARPSQPAPGPREIQAERRRHLSRCAGNTISQQQTETQVASS